MKFPSDSSCMPPWYHQNNYLYYTLCSVLGGSEKYLVSGDPETQQHYSPDYDSKADAFKAANELNEEICEEGFVLLKNEDDVLPMKENARVTVFGKNSVNLVLGGSGSNAGSNASSDTNIYNQKIFGYFLFIDIADYHNIGSGRYIRKIGWIYG